MNMLKDVDDKWNFTIRLLFLIDNLKYIPCCSLLLKLCFGNWRLCVETHTPSIIIFFPAHGSEMESRQPGRKGETNPAAGLMAVVKN